MAKIRWTEEASKWLRDIYDYIAQDKKRFLKELSKLPKDVQNQAEKTVFEDLICENPFNHGLLEQGAHPTFAVLDGPALFLALLKVTGSVRPEMGKSYTSMHKKK